VNAPDGPAQGRVYLRAAIIGLAALAAYSGSFGGPFLFDDIGSIPENPTIRHLWPLWSALSPPAGGLTVSGRPVLNLSFALNYAFGGLNVWGYHAGNLLIHILAGLTLFGILRRTLAMSSDTSSERGMGFQPRLADEHGLPAHATFLAFAVALIWTVHPLQTESVTLVVQRAESLMGLLYLLTLYCAIRAMKVDEAFRLVRGGTRQDASSTFKAPGPRTWCVLSVVACFLGAATKEVMVTAPIVVLLYDRTFVSGTFREAWRRRRGLYAGLASSWVVLGCLVARSGGRAGTAGFDAGVAWWAYALTQFRAIAHYLRLAIWPHPLASDYGRMLGGPVLQVLGDAVIVLGLLGVTGRMICRRVPKAEDGSLLRPASRYIGGRGLGFAGACFFLILAPTSSVVPIATEIIAEHRMYLPLAAVLAVIVVGGYSLLERCCRSALERRRGGPPRPADETRRAAASAFKPLFAVVAVAFCCLTYRRNVVYRSNLAFWADAALKVPDNPGAHNNLGNTLAERGFLDAAMDEYHTALRLDPIYADAHADLGNALVKKGRYAEAISHYLLALRFRPVDPAVHYGLGLALMRSGRRDEARAEFEQTVRLKPDNPDAWSNLAELLVSTGRWDGAADAYAEAIRLRPDNADTRVNYGNVLAQLGRRPEAVTEYQSALVLQPAAADVHNNLGSLLAESGRFDEAKVQFEAALRLRPDYQAARDNLGRVIELERGGGGP